EEGVRFFITSLGKPRWVVERVGQVGGVVYHDVTERKWALKALEAGVRGLIAVNNRAGGHAGPKSDEQLIDELGDLGVPLVCAGGLGDAAAFVAALRLGYAGAQLGTRFIATTECAAHPDYKRAIIEADEDDIVLTERVTGVPLAVIRTPYVERSAPRPGRSHAGCCAAAGPSTSCVPSMRSTRHGASSAARSPGRRPRTTGRRAEV
ncbi:MAG: NAD(P)H-dependent flavin oxidoreductase, partial [bacterium]